MNNIDIEIKANGSTQIIKDLSDSQVESLKKWYKNTNANNDVIFELMDQQGIIYLLNRNLIGVISITNLRNT